MQKSCRQCATKFEIIDDDLKFYDKISPVFAGKKYLVPPPTLCPECRWIRKASWRNFRKIYHRKSDLSGTQFISIYSSEKPYKVYTIEEWWSDKWDPKKYGRDFDFSRTFFEQFMELYDAVPRPGISVSQSENCAYTNMVFQSKDCYLLFGGIHSESCYYAHILWRSKDCMDMLYCYQCEQCYECIDCEDCTNLYFSSEAIHCSDSYHLFDCRNCRNCFGCVGIRDKQFCIYNKQYTEEEYLRLLPELLNPENSAEVQKKMNSLYSSQPKRPFYIKSSENVSGNHIFNSHNMKNCFDIHSSEDCKNCLTAASFKDCYDCIYNGAGLVLGYETLFSIGYHLVFCRDILIPSNDLFYCNECSGVRDCFGCVGLHSKEQYCIFNKQYSKEEYEALVPKIIEHMKQTGEYGEFFPAQDSPFAYNESIAFEYFPLTKDEILAKGLKWKDEDTQTLYQGTKFAVPTHIKQVNDSILKQILVCNLCKKNYKIIPQELDFYRKKNIPVPKNCPDCRHLRRMNLRNPRKLYSRTCAKCAAPIQTTYAPERTEIVYCESCYLKEIY